LVVLSFHFFPIHHLIDHKYYRTFPDRCQKK
jgi:hypothetical protein